ncbi:MAG: hypothetical protein HQ546_05995 [Planctomycetes bacterium]|nr:hypothetical protein [Planctomycetota bacterium]
METITGDDSQNAQTFADQVLDGAEDAMGHGSIVLRHLTKAFRLGMAWTRTRGRPVNLTVSGGTQQYLACVVGVTWIFDQGVNKTELILASPLLKVNS